MQDILADLVAEQQALDQFLQGVRDRDFDRPTSRGWSVRDLIGYLAYIEEFAHDALEEGGSRLDEVEDFASFEDFALVGVKRGRELPFPSRVLEWWRGARAATVEALSSKEGSERVPWFTTEMDAKSFAAARLAETWKVGLDIHHALDTDPEDTPRIRHVAWLAWEFLPYAFEEAGEEYTSPVRVEVFSPDYRKWTFGPPDTDQLVKGQAGEWARVAVGWLDPAETKLSTQGEVAETALRVVHIPL